MHLLFAYFERCFENKFAALVPAALETDERFFQRRVLLQLVSQYHRVFHGLGGSLAKMA